MFVGTGTLPIASMFAALVVGAPQIEWTAPSSCPQVAQVRQRVAALMEAPLESLEDSVFIANGVVEPGEPEWKLELTLTTADGTEARELNGESCEALTDAAAVVISIALSPSAPPAPELPPAKPPPAAPAPAPASPVERTYTVLGFVRLSGGFSAGTLPSVAPAVGVGLGLQRRRFRTEILARYFFARRAEAEDATGQVGQWAFLVHACYSPRVRRVEFPLCAGPEIGMMVGRGEAVDESMTGRLLWLAAILDAGVVFRPVPRVGLWLQVDFVVPITRPGFEIEGVGLVHRASVVGAYGLAGLEFSFP